MLDPDSSSSRIEYPRATFAQSSFQATAIINNLPSYRKIVNECLLDVPDMMYSMCLCAAAEIYQTGILSKAHEAVSSVGDEWKKRPKVQRRMQMKELRHQRDMVVVKLQEVGILPTGFGWIFVKWFVVPFLLELLKLWSIGPDEDLQDQ